MKEQVYDVDEMVGYLWSSSMELGLKDGLWPNFGFKGCPKHGSIINRFRSKKDVDLEDFLTKEFVILGLVEIIGSIYRNVNKVYSRSLCENLLLSMIEDPGNTGLWATWFDTRGQAIHYYHDAIIAYLCSPSYGQPMLFLRRLAQIANINPDRYKDSAVKLFVFQMPLFKKFIETFLSDYEVAKKATVSDDSFIGTVKEIEKILKIRRTLESNRG